MGRLKSLLDRIQAQYVVRDFDIVAITIPITYNHAGDFDPNGRMYVLKENESVVEEFARENPNQTFDLISPLVIRANVGDLIQVRFRNKTNKTASIHIQGVKYDVLDSDGAAVGNNPNTLTNDQRTYEWCAEREGTFLFHDMGDTSSSNDTGNIHGLFGALIVEERGATWTDPITGAELKSGLYADIHPVYKPDFREYVTIFHDEPEVYDRNGDLPINPETGLPDMTMGINYRSEPMRNRMPECENCFGEEVSMSSWPFGDPATPILRAYVGDPSKFRIVNAGIKETHVFHLHNHQWRTEANDPKSTIIDSISISPQQSIDMEVLFGAGSLNQFPGDAIWHCHLYPHFMEGMWGLWRILDRLEDGTRTLPDGSLQPRLVPLPDREAPPAPDEEHPGFPNFLAGIPGEKAFRPPYGIIGVEAREPTPLEAANFVPDWTPGALYSQPCPCNAPVKLFELSAIQLPIVYNNNGWHDPQGRIMVLSEDKDAVLSGEKPVEPLVIRANAGDCIEIRFKNELPTEIGGNAFQLLTTTSEAGFHIHLVKFDTNPSDGSANGWCYDASAIPGDILVERFYANEELNTVFFHDHLFPNVHQQHGLFGALIIEPVGSTYHDPKNGGELKSGTNAVIRPLVGSAYREFALFVHDFAYLFDKDGNPLNPPSVPGDHDDPGVMAINYKNEPLHFRNGDPAYAYSSYVHGDPVTPVLETYAGDPVRIRLLQGAQEEQHAFNMTGLRWRKEITDLVSPVTAAQTMGISEAFNFEISDGYLPGDYLYHFGAVDDLWLGLWGIFRAYGEKKPDLQPLTRTTELTDSVLPLPEKTGTPPQKAVLKDFFTPKKNGVVRKFNVVAMQKDIQYNAFGDHDKDGLLFALAEDEEKIQNGSIEPKPLILRANAGDCIELTLTNHLFNPVPEEHFPEVPVQEDYPASNRVSMHCQMVKQNPLDSLGITVGFNPDQTIAPGEEITYRWYADQELGACLFTSYGDIRNHRHHGLFGGLIIEPTGSAFQSSNGKSLDTPTNEQITVAFPGEKAFREFVLFMQDGLALHDINGNHIMPHEEGEGHEHDIEVEDQGEKGFNYRSERYANRLNQNPDISLVMSSRVHGDPVTPLFLAYAGDNIRIRLLMPADKPRNHCFVLHGHSWKQQWTDPFSDIVSSYGPVSVGNVFNIILDQGASLFPGDYAYRGGAFRWDVEQGMWGIFRILACQSEDLVSINGNEPEKPCKDRCCKIKTSKKHLTVCEQIYGERNFLQELSCKSQRRKEL